MTDTDTSFSFKGIPINKQLLKFTLTSLVLYVVWQTSYYYWINPDQTIEQLLISNITWTSESILSMMGYGLIPTVFLDENIRTLGIDGSHGVYIADSCAGLPLLALFAGFIMAYPGSILKKLWFIPLGIFTVHLINVVRIVALCLLAFHSPELLDFNHHYTFTLIVYAYIFLLWVIWVNKFGAVSRSVK